MLMPSGFDKANRISRKERANQKVSQLIDRLEMTLRDIQRDTCLSDKQKRSIKLKATNRLNKL